MNNKERIKKGISLIHTGEIRETKEEPEKLFTDEQRLQVIDTVEKHALARKKNFGKEFSEPDFFAGAMSAMCAIEEDWIPPAWVFGIMCNRPELLYPNVKGETNAERKTKRKEKR